MTFRGFFYNNFTANNLKDLDENDLFYELIIFR